AYSTSFCFFFDLFSSASSVIYTLSLHDALPIFHGRFIYKFCLHSFFFFIRSEQNHIPYQHFPLYTLLNGISSIIRTLLYASCSRSEEHTSELQSRENLVCRLLLEKKKHDIPTSY